ncbi:uncharacterized protein LOC120334051 [Styela clava]|uniref:protein LRATD2-like n=1 Tax=Styela clava TaxID=7725 RepID=UPI00193A8E00|nr:protein LRATD2-like [Styela clava]XP_039258137.1 protein LRATD2-like [Styela clava]
MGNKASYNQVPIGDMSSPSLHATDIKKPKDASQIPENVGGSDLMFVFHETEDDSEERVVHEQINNQRNIDKELKYTITLNDKLICERLNHAETTDIKSLCTMLQPGDIVEFCAEYHTHHWVVYVGNSQCIRLKAGMVTEEVIMNIHPDRMARLVNGVYKLKSLPIHQVCHAARTQLGKDSVWPTSECFAAWCRFGCPEFMSSKLEIKDLDSPKAESGTEKCKIDIYNDFGEISETKHFTNLVELIKYRRMREKGNKP